ncbi:MAG TPA: glycoside hydrolase family 27 protein, partial [Bacteroidia bacterium]|nr:glycoside hydrolase family 27 protein [Bacteroidia bacterium]
MKHLACILLCISVFKYAIGQNSQTNTIPAATPLMGWMSWNFFGDNITEQSIKEMADAMVASGMRDAGYTYIFIDDGWQGGRD